jgi:hypothetical protein
MGKFNVADVAPRVLFFVSLLMLAFGYGVVAEHYALFPIPIVRQAKSAASQLLEDSGAVLPWYYKESSETQPLHIRNASALSPGLRLISGLAQDDTTFVRVIHADGRTVHSWSIDWFKLWPHPDHLSEERVPKSNPALVHGLSLAPNGDLVFNFSGLGLVRLDACGAVVWRLPYRTHHSVQLDDDGNIWVPGLITREESVASLPNYFPRFEDFRILEVSSDGHIKRDIGVIDLLAQNDLRGLLYLSSTVNRNTTVSGDTMHLNDIQVFPKSLTPGLFEPGDVMISLRNINAIVVFDPKTLRIKYKSVGQVLRQHDPDFVDGNTITVFDNNNMATWPPDATRPDRAGQHSRIVQLSASGQATVLFTGSDQTPFFTDIMGSHERLPNGNWLLMESVEGRVFEVDRNGNVVWEYINVVGKGRVGLVDDAFMLPANVDDAFFERAVSACASSDRE